MADHVRKRIRDAAAASGVLGNLATTGARVYKSRVHPLQDTDVGAGALRVYTRDEEVEAQSMGVGRVRQRLLSLVVEACVKAVTGYDDTIDQIQKEVEIALDANQGLSGLCKSIELKTVEDAFETDEKVVAVKRMTFEVLYYTAQGAPDVPL